MSMGYFAPKLGIIFLKFFHGLPFGSLRKNLTFSMATSLFNSGRLVVRPFWTDTINVALSLSIL